MYIEPGPVQIEAVCFVQYRPLELSAGLAWASIIGNVRDSIIGNARDCIIGNARDGIIGNTRDSIFGNAEERTVSLAMPGTVSVAVLAIVVIPLNGRGSISDNITVNILRAV